MGKYILIFFCFLWVKGSCQSGCDCFERLYQLAGNDTDLNRSAMILKDAISFLDETRAGEYYWEVGQRYQSAKQYDSSAVWYEKAVRWGYDIENVQRNSRDVYNRMDTTKMRAIAMEHRKKINFVVYDAFVSQNVLDQAVRNDQLFSRDKYAEMTACEKNTIDTMFQRVDRSTFLFLAWYFENYGFPTFHQLGFYPVGIGAMILHVTANNNEKASYLLKMLEEMSKNCAYTKFDVLMLKDRRQYINEKKNLAGLFGSRDRFQYIENIDKADSIRFAHNCVRLKEDAESGGGKLPTNYKPLPYPKNYFCLKKYEIK